MQKLAVAAPILAALAWTPYAVAVECTPENELSSCIDADDPWFPAGEAHFASLSSARTAAPGTLSFAIGAAFLNRPVVLQVPSPDRDGREVLVVKNAFNVTPAFALGLAPNLELTLATPVSLWQSGAGIGGLTSQSSAPLPSTSVRDPRIGAAYALPRLDWLETKLELELKLPWGDSQAFAGERGVVTAPSLVVEAHAGRFRAGLELGLRLRSEVELAGVRVGDQLWSAIGARYDIFEGGRLSLGLEAWALPSLAAQPSDGADPALRDASYVPAEWMATVGSTLARESDVYLVFGAGGALALSSATRRSADGSERTEHFAGVGTPAVRAVLGVRYVPRARRD